MSISITVNIPSLDRLCGLIEHHTTSVRQSRNEGASAAKQDAPETRGPTQSRTRGDIQDVVQQALAAIDHKLAQVDETVAPVVKAPEPIQSAPEAPVSAPEAPVSAPEETATEKPAEAPEPPAEAPVPTPAAPKKSVTVDAIQRAAAELRDQGKLKAVTDLFPSFGIRKLSDLKGDQLPEFAVKLREMGAKL